MGRRMAHLQVQKNYHELELHPYFWKTIIPITDQLTQVFFSLYHIFAFSVEFYTFWFYGAPSLSRNQLGNHKKCRILRFL